MLRRVDGGELQQLPIRRREQRVQNLLIISCAIMAIALLTQRYVHHQCLTWQAEMNRHNRDLDQLAQDTLNATDVVGALRLQMKNTREDKEHLEAKSRVCRGADCKAKYADDFRKLDTKLFFAIEQLSNQENEGKKRLLRAIDLENRGRHLNNTQPYFCKYPKHR